MISYQFVNLSEIKYYWHLWRPLHIQFERRQSCQQYLSPRDYKYFLINNFWKKKWNSKSLNDKLEVDKDYVNYKLNYEDDQKNFTLIQYPYMLSVQTKVFIHHQASSAVLDFQIPCFPPETPVLYPRSFVTNHKGRGRKLGGPRRL